MEEKKLSKRLARAKESGKLDDWKMCCRRLAEHYVTCGKYEQALTCYQEELSVAKLKEDTNAEATAHRMIGEVYNSLGQFKLSLDHINRYLDYAKTSRNSVEQQRALATIGRTYFCWASDLQASETPRDAEKAQEKLQECRKAYMKSLYICEHDLKDTNERHEMKARILFNMGLAYEIEDEISTALDYVTQSIAICQKERLLEDLHRCYISQGSLLMKKGDGCAALKAMEEACEVAKKLSNEALVLAMLHKSEIFFSMGSYMSAKTVLKKAYKLKTPNSEDRSSVECALKRAILLCDLESKLANERSLDEKKILYEKLGDASCRVKNFKYAIKSYENMLDCALKLGHTGKELQPCYVSLYETYKDYKNYDLALEYARKEYELSKNSPVEAAKSHLVIGELLELKNDDYYKITDEYMEAKKIAEDIKDTEIMGSALRRLVMAQKNGGREALAEETQRELNSLCLLEEDSQSEDELSPTEDINLSDLSDSDQERPRSTKFKMTKNEKGETPLHLAAIKGDLSRAERLISLGHPVKERDLAGWTPLHEAANHGHAEIVHLLLKSGADANDPGGRDCGGVTPLHDAASCGNFDVIKILLQHGASVTVLTDAGDTPLDCLKDWRGRVDDLSDEDVANYAQIVKELEGKLSAAGVEARERSTRSKPEGIIKRRVVNKPILKPRNERESSRRENYGSEGRSIRRDFDVSRNNWEILSPEKCDSPVSQLTQTPVYVEHSPPRRRKSPTRNEKPVADYCAAIDALRKRPLPIDRPKASQPALIDANAYVDEWLEDDLRQNRAQKKRKLTDFIERTERRKSDEARRDDTAFFYPLDDPADFLPVERQAKKKPKVQTTLGAFRLQPSQLPTPEVDATPSFIQPPLTPPRPYDTSYDLPPSPPFSSVSDHQALTKVRVNVGTLMLLVPVDTAKVNELTVKWLAEEAARRYCELEGAEPLLQLKTRDGARIAATDPVSVTLGEDLDSTIVGWKTVSLAERYRDAVAQELDTNSISVSAYGGYLRGPDVAVIDRLSACDLSKWLDLEYMALTSAELAPVLRALRHERKLSVINLAGNVLCDDGLTTLLQCLSNCSLEEINLRCNNITGAGVSSLTSMLPNMSQQFLSSMRSIDLSCNPIGDINEETRGKLKDLMPNLTQLKTDYCDS